MVINKQQHINNQLSTSLIISTYNAPQALNLCLLSVVKQKLLPSEVIIADDGSTEETKKLITQFQKDFPIPLKHVWQADEGFQLAKIRNKAIASSTGDYIIQVDGDLILHAHFIADHVSFSKKNSFVTGSRVILNASLSARLLNDNNTAVQLLWKGVLNKSNGLRIRPLRNYLAQRYRANDMYFMRGCNMAFWKDDLIRVNGYNEEFTGWGREDNEVAVRLINNGIQKRVIKFGAVVFHIFHPEKPRSNLTKNDTILKEAIELKKMACPIGLNQYL
jgi:glycosyltransferase involved in cell wall biosynthesis